jgi:electron transport complex protein RnfD
MGVKALYIVFATVLSAIITEAIIQRARSKRLTVSDGSAMVTGLIISLLLPIGVPVWIPVAGAVFAIAVVKHAFGGQGHNIFNPAVGGWIFLTMSWSAYTVVPAMVSTEVLFNPSAVKLGNISPVAFLLGGTYLLLKRVITWPAPFGFIFTTILLSTFFGGTYYLTGLFVLFAFFIITDPVTTPITWKGRALFGIGCGMLTALYSAYGSYEEGLALSVILMNSITPWLDWLAQRRGGMTSD